MAFLNALPGAVAEGLIWGLMAIGVYISYKILDIADLTVDGSICTGACVCAVLLALGVPAWISVVAALAAGAITGVVTGLLHTRLGIPSILAGILTQLMLYSVNLLILGGKSLVAIDPRANQLLVHMSRNNGSIVSLVIIAGITIFLLYEFFYTEIGLTLKSTGDNPDMSRAQGVDVTNMPEHKRAAFLGRVFQDPMKGTAPDMEIAENLAIASKRGMKRRFVRGVRKADRERYRELLKTLDLGLEDRLSTKVGLLSGGQRQAVTLLMASMNKPKLLMLDEHTAALDPQDRR